jgi:hypothetical protein
MIKIVTITGADDSIRPEALIELTVRFPFVEWAILFSRSSQGQNRFPSLEWVKQLVHLKATVAPQMKLSAHLCGAYVRELLNGEIDFINEIGEVWPAFERVQINTHGQPHIYRGPVMIEALNIWPDKEFIFQYDEVNKTPLMLAHQAGVNCSALFDLSHGAGVLPSSWPLPMAGIKCGYAGGIGPENIADQLYKIMPLVEGLDSWVDMETKVRSENDRLFDLNKVGECLFKADQITGWEQEPDNVFAERENSMRKYEANLGKAAPADYEPYGPEWEKEMAKQPKDVLIQMLKRFMIHAKADLEALNKGGNE